MMPFIVKYKNQITILICTIITLWPSFYNQYPLLGNDTAAYLASGHSGEIPVDRPIYYGLLLRHLTLSRSLWIGVVLQAMLINYCFYSLYKLLNSSGSNFILIFIISIISVLTPFSTVTNYILPDVFTAILIISFVLLFFETNKIKTWTWTFIFLYSILTHYSHYPTALSLSITTLLLTLIFKLKPLQKRAFILLCISIFVFPFTVLLNYIVDGKASLSRSTHIFIAGKFLQDGHLNRLLREHCNDNNYELCGKTDRLETKATNFLWSSSSPLYDGPCGKKEFGECFESKDSLYKKMVYDVIKYYPVEVIKSSILTGLEQLYTFEQIDLLGDDNQSKVQVEIRMKWHYDKEYKYFIKSVQSNGQCAFSYQDRWTKIFFYTSLIIILISFLFQKNPYNKILLLIVISGLVFNAFFCASLSDVSGRYQSRIIFIPIFIAIVWCFQFICGKYNRISKD